MKTTRRGFIQQTTAMVGAGAAPWLANLAAIGEASAQSAPGDYKALVCLFMVGGNDHANTLVPFDQPSNAKYLQYRKDLYYHMSTLKMGDQESDIRRPDGGAWPGAMSTLDQLVLADSSLGARQFALAPPLTPLKALYDTQKLAVVLNVGTLVEPVVGVWDTSIGGVALKKAPPSPVPGGYSYQVADLPPRLGSHNDQVSIWQASNPEGATVGWGGRTSDEVGAANGKPVFSAVSVSGNTVFLTGTTSVPYQVTTYNSISIPLDALRIAAYGSAAVSTALGQIVTGTGSTLTHMMEQDLTAITRRSISTDDVLRGMPLSGNDPLYAPLSTLADSGNDLAAQLRTVAHLIRNRAITGAKRQVFYVQLGGFDNHSALVANHPWLLGRVATAMAAFQQVLEGLPHPENASNPVGMGGNVTTFTASDFGRTFNSNGDGTDHGWGGMHFVMGGAVNGRRIYGKAPVFGDQVKRADGMYYQDTVRGTLIPTTSVDQYAATLARWMGVPDSKMGTPTFLPNLAKFDAAAGRDPGFNWGRNLGFMKPA
ncbi:MAG: DUF1501 domain-containing protein [Rubrivivax sp.]|nr:MAG: DUF1501 domain-containing protein [Rubrivivax sp.]